MFVPAFSILKQFANLSIILAYSLLRFFIRGRPALIASIRVNDTIESEAFVEIRVLWIFAKVLNRKH